MPTYTDEERAIISKSMERRKNPPPKYTSEEEKDGKHLKIAIPPEKPQLDYAKFILAFGTVHDLTHTLFLNQVAQSFPAHVKGIDRVNIAAALMYGIAPNNELEAMLGLQMVATHNLAMEQLGRAMRSEHRDATRDDINLATKLLLTYTARMEALNRNRGKSPGRKVTVEHVHVNAGGQAVVGNVERVPEGRRGVMIKTEEPPLAMHRSPRCGAHCKRSGLPCRMPAMANGRCFPHGGKSTGPRTLKGIQKCRQAPLKHGRYSRESLDERRKIRILLSQTKKLLRAKE